MKKVLGKLLAASLAFVMIVAVYSAYFSQPKEAMALYEGEEDASCLETVDSYWYFTSWRVLHQWWRPKHNQINEFWMYIDSTGGGTFNLDIKQWLAPQAVIVDDQTVTGHNAIYDWVGFDFPNKSVTNGDLYWASVTGSYPNRWWFHQTDDCWEQNMTQGVTSYGNLSFYYDYDFIFWVYGQDAETPPAAGDTPPDTPPAGSPPAEDPGGVATGSDQPTAASDSVSSINPPSGAKAEDVQNDEGGAIKISWSKSDSPGLSGYRIFRSETEDGKYLRIGSVKTSVLEYADSGLEIGKQYYYLVRSYNSKGESADSNKVPAASVDNLAPATVKDFKAEYNSLDKAIDLTWGKNTEIDLDGYVIKYGTAKEELDKTVEARAGVVKYRLMNVGSEKSYYFVISAKDTHGNISSPAEANLQTPKVTGISWLKNVLTLPTYIGGGLIILLATLLIILIIKRKKLKGIKLSA